jgi:hypothetical protein
MVLNHPLSKLFGLLGLQLGLSEFGRLDFVVAQAVDDSRDLLIGIAGLSAALS